MMQACWLADPNDRPTFTMIKQNVYDVFHLLKQDSVQGKLDFMPCVHNDDQRVKYKIIRSCSPLSQKQQTLECEEKLKTTITSTEVYVEMAIKLKEDVVHNAGEKNKIPRTEGSRSQEEIPLMNLKLGKVTMSEVAKNGIKNQVS